MYQPPPHQPQASQVVVAPTSELAVIGHLAHRVALPLCGLGSVVAVICGGLALKQTKDGRRGGHGLAVAGIIVGGLGLIPADFFLITSLISLMGAALSGAPHS